MKSKVFLFSLLALLLTSFSIHAHPIGKVRISPYHLVCPNTQVGQTTTCDYIQVINETGASVYIRNIVIGDTYNFIVDTSDCYRQTVWAGESCIIPVSFSPKESRDFESGVTVSYTDFRKKNREAYSDISGVGVAPLVWLSTDKVDFGDQTIGTSSSEYVTLKNVGTDTLDISNITAPIGSAFTAGGDCGDTLEPLSSCTILISFLPTAETSYLSNVRIDDNAEDSPQFIEARGVGIPAGQPDVSLSRHVVDYGNKLVGSSSDETVTVTNIGTVPLTIASIAASGTSFSQSNDCGAGLDVDESCTITITFAPGSAGAFSGTVTLNDNATDSPQTITLEGSGVAPNATLSPDVIEFGNQTINKSSAAHEIILLNSGTSDLTITEIAVSSIFSQTNDCPSVLEPKHSCVIAVVFTPTATGFLGGTLTVSDDDPGGSPQVAFLFGTGITGPDVDIVPGFYDFGNVKAGETSQPQEFEVTNTGEGELDLYSITTNSDFTQTNDCPSALDEGEYCVVDVTFAPAVAGNFFGLLSIADNAEGSPHIANLWGYGTTSDITLIPASINFGDQTIGKSSLVHSIRFLNSGNTAITITSIATGSDIFTQTNDCGETLAPAAYCTIGVTFSPTAVGDLSGTVTITDSASGSPHNVALSGTGVDPIYPDLDVSPTYWDFGYVIVGQTSVVQAFTVKNTGDVDVTIYSIDANSEFTETNNCPATLSAGQTCTISGIFSPGAAGNFSGHIKITDNTPAGYQLVSLFGTATNSGDIDIDISTSSINFGNVTLNTTSDPQTIVVTNAGTDDLSIGAVSLEGSDSSQFIKSTNCQERTLDSGKSCIINVSFKPAMTGVQKAYVQIYDDAADSPQQVTVEGIGGTSGGCSFIGSSSTLPGIMIFSLMAAVPLLARIRRKKI